jgi:hypothetical protein
LLVSHFKSVFHKCLSSVPFEKTNQLSSCSFSLTTEADFNMII